MAEEHREATDQPLGQLPADLGARIAHGLNLAFQGFTISEILSLDTAVDQAVNLVLAQELAGGSSTQVERLRDQLLPNTRPETRRKVLAEVLNDIGHDGDKIRKQIKALEELRNRVAHAVGDDLLGLGTGADFDGAWTAMEEAIDGGEAALASLLSVITPQE